VKHNDKEIVSAVRRALIERIGEDRFNVWFGPGIRLAVSGRSVCIEAGDQFTVERIRKRFLGDITSVVAQILGTAASVDFRIEASLQATPEKRAVPLRKSASGTGDNPGGADTRPQRTSATRQDASLDEFIVGPCNQVAFAGCQSVLRHPGQMSPLMLYGPTGTGKTHLLEGIAQAARRTHGLKRVVMLSSEQFTSYFLEALRGTGLPNFRRKYRDVNMLLIDDLQFFVGKNATIVELKHTVDTLLRGGRQLVFTADRPLPEIDGLGPDLIARISGGLVCALEAPDEETRLAIARRSAITRGLNIPDPVLTLIANQVSGDVRLIRGALNRLQAVSDAIGRPVTVRMAQEVLGDIFRAAQPVVRLPDIESAVCGLFGVGTRDLHSHRKSKTLAQPRMLAMWLARKYTRAAYLEIGEHFGHRSHSTVISANKKVEDWLAGGARIQLGHSDCDVRDIVRRVEAQLRTG
jgi:chromosomal replication initiator protein